MPAPDFIVPSPRVFVVEQPKPETVPVPVPAPNTVSTGTAVAIGLGALILGALLFRS
jgi:hypothetical protein